MEGSDAAFFFCRSITCPLLTTVDVHSFCYYNYFFFVKTETVVQENITKLKAQEEEIRSKSGMAPGLLGGQEVHLGSCSRFQVVCLSILLSNICFFLFGLD